MAEAEVGTTIPVGRKCVCGRTTGIRLAITFIDVLRGHVNGHISPNDVVATVKCRDCKQEAVLKARDLYLE